MFRLLEIHYKNTRRVDFDKDLAEKEWVILLNDANSGEMKGFSTQMIFSHQFQGEEVKVLFSGDTIIDKKYWGGIELPLAFVELMLHLIKKNFEYRLYWMLISKGVRTYKFLPVFFKDFYPRFDKETPPELDQFLKSLGRKKFPETFDSKSGIVRARRNGQYLKKQYHPTPDINKKAHVNFFYNKNPGYLKGDELLCIAELKVDNMRQFIMRELKRTGNEAFSFYSQYCLSSPE